MNYGFGGGYNRFYQQEEPFDAEESWRKEERMGNRSRRERYKCGKNFAKLVDIMPWPQYYEEYLKPDEPEPQLEEAEVKATEAPAPTEAASTEAASTEAASTEAVVTDGAASTPAETSTAETADTAEGSTTEIVNTVPAPTEATTTEVPVVDATIEAAPVADGYEAPPPAEATEGEEKPAEAKEESTEEENKTEESSDEESSESSSSDEPLYPPNKEINRRIAHFRGDICKLEIDAIVNAANSSLLGGGGIDGAIHSAAGYDLLRECRTLNGARTGETKITRGYRLPAKYVLHTVGPRGEYEEHLENCYKSILALCKKHGIRSVALCGVSTGIFGYPLYNASHVACRIVREWLEVEENRNAIDRIIFCTFLEKEKHCYEELLQQYFPVVADPEFAQEWSQYVEGYQSPELLTQESSTSESDETPEEKTEEKGKDGESNSEESETEAPSVIFGKALLRDGEAEITIPPNGFEDKWEDFYYQLTPVRSYAQVYVKKELKDGKFTIATNDSNKEALVHWQIRGDW